MLLAREILEHTSLEGQMRPTTGLVLPGALIDAFGNTNAEAFEFA